MMNESKHDSRDIQGKNDQKVQNYNNVDYDLDNYEYYYYDDEEEEDNLTNKQVEQGISSKQNINQSNNKNQQKQSSSQNSSTKGNVSIPSSIAVDNNEIKSANIIVNSDTNDEKQQCSKSLSLPDYKPKNMGKGFSSTSDDDDDDEYDSNNKPTKTAKLPSQKPIIPTENNDDYYSDDFPEESSQADLKIKSSQKHKSDSSSNKIKKKIDNNNDESKDKEKSPPTNKKNRSNRRRSTSFHRGHKHQRKRHHKKNSKSNSAGNTSIDSVDSSNSFDSNYSFNSDDKEEEKTNSVICDSSLTYSIEGENDQKIKKIVDDYEMKNSQIQKENEILHQKIKQLETEKNKLQNEIFELKESAKYNQKKQQEEINNLKEENKLLQKKQQEEINNLKEANKLLQKKKEDEINNLKEENKQLQKNAEANKSSATEEVSPSFTAIDRFKDVKTRKVCLLGRGSSSKVIEVEDIKTGKHYAKKILFKEFLDFKGIKHFIAEFELLQYLSHPCTATVYGFEMGADEEHPCSIYFEVLQVSLMSAISASDSLAQTLSTATTNSDSNLPQKLKETVSPTTKFLSIGHKLFTNSLRARCLVEICCGMEYVHDCGIIHRDLKAENILFNETLNAKICDFGIAQLQCAENLTKNVGSLFYMSPEMLSEKVYDKSTDIYSFGILAFFVLTGELPKTPLNKKVLGCLPDVPSFVTPLGKEIIVKCCAFNPKERPSFSDLLELMKNNDFQLIKNIDNGFVRKRYDELMHFKQMHPAQLIK